MAEDIIDRKFRPAPARMFDGLGIPASVATPAFQLIDRDHDGSISHDEYRAAVEEFCLSAEPEAAGHHLLGSPLEAK